MSDNIDVKDGAAATKTVRTIDASGIHTPVHVGTLIVNNANTAISCPAAGLTTLATISNDRYKLLSFHFDVAAQALDAFQISARAHSSAQYVIFGVTGNSWTNSTATNSNIAPGSRILETNQNLDAVAAANNGYFSMNISGLVDIKVEASGAVNNANVTPRWSLQ